MFDGSPGEYVKNYKLKFKNDRGCFMFPSGSTALLTVETSGEIKPRGFLNCCLIVPFQACGQDFVRSGLV